MSIELTKEAAIDLLKSIKPNYDVIDKIPNDLGYLCSGMVNSWHWKKFDVSTQHTIEELYNLYLLCKKSWCGIPEKKQYNLRINSEINVNGEIVLWYN